jgi:hypothetical protein
MTMSLLNDDRQRIWQEIIRLNILLSLDPDREPRRQVFSLTYSPFHAIVCLV